jgi:putative ABC transport system permease protein
VYHETHYDRHHARAGDLFLVGTTFVKIQGLDDGEDHETYNTPAPMAEALMQEFPEIEKTTRIQGVFEGDKTLLRSVEDGLTQKAFNEPKGYFADSTYFDLFQYQFLEGNSAKALTSPQSVVLSEDVARKFFGNEPAYGRSIRISSNTWFEGGDLDFRVTGVFRQPTESSHLDGRFFMSLYSGGLGDFLKRKNDLATNNMFTTYLLLHPGSDGKALEAKLPAFVDKYMASDLKERGFNKKQFLTALPDVHLSDIGAVANEGSNSITYLYILSSIALFTLLIACVNFMNLSTARSARRAGEVGVRKSVGASKGNLVRQFLSESVLIAVASFVLALGLAWAALPFFNRLAERELSLSVAGNPLLFGGFFMLALLTGLVAGIYPAFYLSSFRPVEVLKGKFVNSLSATFLRKGLVVFQFVISAGLILASLVIGTQMRYMQSKDLGFYKDRQIVLPMLSKSALTAYEPLKAELQRDSRISGVGASLYYPGILNPSDAGFRREGQAIEQSVVTRRNWVDADFLTTLGVQPVAGRLFSREFPSDTSFKVIVNETGVRKYGFASPAEAINQKIMFDWRGREYRFEVIGVVKDFHFESLHEPIEPYSFELNNNPQFNYLIARAGTADMPALLASIENIWKRLVPGEPFEYSFLDDDFQKNYKADRQMAGLVGSLTGIAILISCLGLFGLAAFAAERRTKEIGIRKVLGASVAGITGLLATDFLKLVLIAIVLASPLAWWAMNQWLQDFAYRIAIEWWMFAAAGAVAVAIAFLTVSFQSIRAALANPVKSLRSE